MIILFIFYSQFIIRHYNSPFRKRSALSQIYLLRLIIKIQIQIVMNRSSSRERLKMAHEIVDKELKSNFINPSSTFDSSRTKNVQSEISELERKLMDLEKKMGSIDVESSNDDPDDGEGDPDEGDQVEVYKKCLDQALSKEKVSTKSKMRDGRPFEGKKGKPGIEGSSEEDSGNDGEIYAKIMEKDKTGSRNWLAGKKQGPTIERKSKIDVEMKKGSQEKRRNSLRDSVKSFKSNKSRVSISSRKSNLSKKPGLRENSRQGMRELEIENMRDGKKISNLEKELRHYKRLCKRQEQRLEEYRVMEIEYRKLEANFTKSEQIRKQQKKIIDGLKTKY